ncbi:MAG: hypothetical protein GX076_04885 [Clostridiales bacterium]|nr:hypothetical protein [Clostridiales bacterium]
MKNIFKIICFIFLITVVLLSSGLLETASYGANYSYPIYYEGNKLSETGYYEKNTPYIPVSVAEKYGDLKGLSIDYKNKRINIDLSKLNIMMADDVTTNFAKSHAGIAYTPLKEIEGKLYAPLNILEQFLKLSYTVNSSSIKLYSYKGTEQIARINSDEVRIARTLQSNNRQAHFPTTKGEMVFIESETRNYYRVKSQDGVTGYVMKSDITIYDIDLSKVDFYAPKKEKYVQGNEKINLVWQYVGTVTPEAPSKKDGIDILSPTWFDLIVNGDGSVENNGDKGFTDMAHDRGYMVWATITNNMGKTGSTAFTSKVFKNSALLNRSVAQFLFYSCLYDVDGICIDYEQVLDEDANGLTSFTALLRNFTERQGLNLSICTLVPKPWTIEYDRKALAKYVDYIAVMTYDEHYSGSPVAGSIASLPWVEEAVQATLNEVPSNQVLLGIPMYTRVWVVDSNGKVVRNPSATMPYVQNFIKENNFTPIWLEKEKQYFISYPNGPYTDKIWIEDSRSVANRLKLVQDYNLAGSACWQFSQASEDIWQVFNGMLKQGKTLKDYE